MWNRTAGLISSVLKLLLLA